MGTSMQDEHHYVKTFLDWLSLLVAGATVLQWLPIILAVPGALWGCTRLYEAIQGKPFSESKLATWLRGTD